MTVEFRLEIERLASGGEGVGHAPDGRVVFVPATAPGDHVDVRIIEEQKRFLRAEVIDLVTAGPGRVAPRCSLVGTCGGCTWQHLDYPTQCQAKAERVAETFARVAGIELSEPVECTPSPDPFGYRSRARVGFRDGVIGFRQTGSHTLCPASACPVLVPALDQELARLSANPPDGNGELTLAAGEDGGVCVTGDASAGSSISIRAADHEIEISPGVFFQANALLRTALATAVHEAAGRGSRAMELFAGSGYFTIGLAERFDEVLVVEAQGRATKDLVRNLARAGRENVDVVTGVAERSLSSPRLTDFAPDVVVLDPPRKGLEGAAVERIAALAPRRVVYVSCDPATHARDAKKFVGLGYAVQSLRAFDLFPQTSHVEAIAVLDRTGAERS